MTDSSQARQTVDTVVHAGLLITMDHSGRVIPRGSVAIDQGRIVAVDSADAINGAFAPRAVVDRANDVVTPGYVDAHVHLSHHLIRSAIPDHWPEEREHEIWLPYWLSMTAEDAYHSSLLACLEMVRNGTTTFCDMSGRFDAEIEAAAAEAVGIRGIVSEVCWDIPPHPDVSIGTTDECVARLERLVARFPRREDRLVWAAVGMSGMGRASDELLIAGSQIARRTGVAMYMHQSFAEADTRSYEAASEGQLAVQHLADLGVLGPQLALVHMIKTDAREVPLLATHACSVVHCPAASIRWGLGVSHGQFPEMVAAGINVALGSDSANYSDSFDIGRQAYLAATIHREARQLTPTVSCHEALLMATVNGARALGIASDIGSLEVSKKADLVVHDGMRPEWHPIIDPIQSLIYSAQSSTVKDVMINGDLVLLEGTFTRIDAMAALEAIDRASAAVWARMTEASPSYGP